MGTVKKVDMNGITNGNYGSYQYGSMSSYDPKYQTQIDDTLGKIQNYGEYKSQYQPQIDTALDKITNATPYVSKYQAQIDDYVNKIQNGYNPNEDATYLAYRDQYLRGGQRAMLDTMANAVALSGGYDNSYANSVGQQQYQNYVAALADKIPELAKAANDMYNSRLSMFQNLDQTDYGRWSDERANNYNQLNTLLGMDNTAYGRWNDSRTNLYNLLNAYNTQEDTNYGRWKDEYAMYNTAYAQQQALLEAALAAAGGGGGGRNGKQKNNNPTSSSDYISTVVNPMVSGGTWQTTANNGKVTTASQAVKQDYNNGVIDLATRNKSLQLLTQARREGNFR